MLSRKLYFVFTLGAILFALLVTIILPPAYKRLSIFIVPFVIMLALTYVFSPQIDWWWYQKHPPKLANMLSNMLMRHFSFYKNLSAENKKRFRQRVEMYKRARGFYARLGKDDADVPEDIKTIIAANVVMLTFGQKEFILDPFERIIVYMQAFPSPRFQQLHASETQLEDHVFIFSAEHLTLSFRQPQKYYNIALHEFAKAYREVYKKYDYPEFDEKVWGGFSKEAITKFIGFPEVDAFPVSVNFFFLYPKKFKEMMPEVFEKYQTIFNLNPLNSSDPVVDKTFLGKR